MVLKVFHTKRSHISFTFCTLCKGMAEEEEGIGTKLTCLQPHPTQRIYEEF